MDESASDASQDQRVAFYASRKGGASDWWTLLHPPYTAWHLSYVVIGACLAPAVNTWRLIATLLAFFFAVGLAAHALDELHGRPLQTHIPSIALFSAVGMGLIGALVFGVVGIVQVGWALLPFLIVGPLLVVAYNYEMFDGAIHNDAGFAIAWGAFPLLTAYVAQTGRLAPAPVVAAMGAAALSMAQRTLSTPARLLRRRARDVVGQISLQNYDALPIDREVLLVPLERSLHALSWSIILIATALAIERLA